MELELLPGEGDTKTVVSTRVRIECDECGAPAKYKHTFLLENARRNPASSAYGHDDCSYCEDGCLYVCEDHKNLKTAPPGQSWCATFTAVPKFAHMFLRWADEAESSRVAYDSACGS